MEDTVKKARNYAWKCFAVLSVGAVIHLIVSFHEKLWFLVLLSTTITLIRPYFTLFTLISPLSYPYFTLYFTLFYPYFQTHTEDSKEYIQQMAALRGVSVADYVIMTGGPTRLIKAFFPAQPLLIPNL